MIVNGKELEIKMNGRIYHCALDVTMDYIGGKWKSVVLWYLRNKTMRFGELRKQIPDITEKMLSMQLKQLEMDGIVKREVFPEVPPRVEYSLTKEGKGMLPMLEALAEWGRTKAKRDGVIQERKRVVKAKK
ncbi:MAG: helix-turn-helix transcriptional regulator [Bacteroidia bacterium]|nr:helix-turn-helix transcriptional regulator [Bacteroidia bacterium]